MAVKQGDTITITSVKGGVGKTVNTLNIAGILSSIGKKVLIIDLDLYTGGVACSLNIENDKDLFLLVNDMSNNKFDYLENYIIKYNENIDIIPAPKDPRDASKISPKYLNVVISKAKMKYDVVLIDTNHLLTDTNLVILDNSDVILYFISNDLIDLKNMKSMTSIFRDMEMDNYKVILNNSLPQNKKTFNNYDIKTVIKSKIDFTLSNKLYDKNIDKYIIDGKILTLDKNFVKNHKKEIEDYQTFLESLLKKKVKNNG